MNFKSGDYIKFEVKDEKTGTSEWMWLRVESCDDSKQLVFGQLDTQPVVFSSEFKLGQHLAIAYENMREHKPSVAFTRKPSIPLSDG